MTVGGNRPSQTGWSGQRRMCRLFVPWGIYRSRRRKEFSLEARKIRIVEPKPAMTKNRPRNSLRNRQGLPKADTSGGIQRGIAPPTAVRVTVRACDYFATDLASVVQRLLLYSNFTRAWSSAEAVKPLGQAPWRKNHRLSAGSLDTLASSDFASSVAPSSRFAAK